MGAAHIVRTRSDTKTIRGKAPLTVRYSARECRRRNFRISGAEFALFSFFSRENLTGE